MLYNIKTIKQEAIKKHDLYIHLSSFSFWFMFHSYIIQLIIRLTSIIYKQVENIKNIPRCDLSVTFHSYNRNLMCLATLLYDLTRIDLFIDSFILRTGWIWDILWESHVRHLDSIRIIPYSIWSHFHRSSPAPAYDLVIQLRVSRMACVFLMYYHPLRIDGSFLINPQSILIPRLLGRSQSR